MSTSSISSLVSSNQTDLLEQISQRKQYSQKLASNIEAGDISGAQQAFAQLLQGNMNTAQTNSTINKDFDELSDAFTTGDITSVKNAFTTLQRDTQTIDPTITSSLQPDNLTSEQLAFASLEKYNQNSYLSNHRHHSASDSDSTGNSSYTSNAESLLSLIG